MSHNPERKICVQYNPGPDDEAGSSNEKIREATLSKEYDLQDVPTMQALLQKVAKDFPMVQDRVNLVYDDGKYVGPEIIETDAEMTDVTIEGSGPVAAYKRPQEKVLGKIKSICQFRSYQNVLEEQIENSLDADSREIQLHLDRCERFLSFTDDGEGIERARMRDIMAFGDDEDRDFLDGDVKIGEYNEGMKSLCKFGLLRKELTWAIRSKTEESKYMAESEIVLAKVWSEKIWQPLVVRKPLDTRRFCENGTGTEAPFPGKHGTEISARGVDEAVFDALCFENTNKLKCLPELAAKFCFRVMDGQRFLNQVLRVSGASEQAPFRSLVNHGRIRAGQDELRGQDNVVLERLLGLIDNSEDRAAARTLLLAQPCETEGWQRELAAAAEKWSCKPIFFREYPVEVEHGAAGDKQTKIGNVKVLAYFNSSQGNEDDSDAEGGAASGQSPKQVMAFWGLLYLANFSMQLPWFESARKDKNNRPGEHAAYDKVVLMVFFDKAFRPDPHKQGIGCNLFREHQSMKATKNNRSKFKDLTTSFQAKMSEWYAADVREEYGPLETVKLESSQYSWEWADIKNGRGNAEVSQSTSRSKTREGQGKVRLLARRVKDGKTTEGSFVEFEVTPSGNGRSSKTLRGYIAALLTNDRDPITIGTARIDIPYAEPMEVPVSKIRLSCDELQHIEAIKVSMPKDMVLYMPDFVPQSEDGPSSSEKKKKKGAGTKTVTSKDGLTELHWMRVHKSSGAPGNGRAGASLSSPSKLHVMTADQADNFQLMVEVTDGKGNLVKHGGKKGHDNNAVMNLENMNMRVEVRDRTRNNIALPDPQGPPDGDEWFDVVKVASLTGARYFTSKRPTAINNFLRKQGKYRVVLSFGFRDSKMCNPDRMDETEDEDKPEQWQTVHGQRRSVQEHLDEIFHCEPPGLHGYFDVDVIPGMPHELRVDVEKHCWLGESRLFRELSIKDKFGNLHRLPEVVQSIEAAISPDLGLKPRVTKEGNKWKLIIDGIVGQPLPVDEVSVNFKVTSAWTDMSTLPGKGTTKATESCNPQILCSKDRPSLVVHSGKPEQLTISTDMPTDGWPRGEPLCVTVGVKDRWGNPFKGKRQYVTYELALVASDGMLSPNELTLVDQEQGLLRVRGGQAKVVGNYMDKGQIEFRCTVCDMRDGDAEPLRYPLQVHTMPIQVEKARLVFVVPERFQVTNVGDDWNLEIESKKIDKLKDIVVQLQQPSGAVMKKVDGLFDPLHLLMKRGATVKPSCLSFRRGEVLVEIDQTMSCQYVATFHGLKAVLTLKLKHGAPKDLKFHSDETAVTVGKDWTVYFRVHDDAGVALTKADELVWRLDCEDGLSFDVKDGSIRFDDNRSVFEATVVPRGCLTSETSKATVTLTVSSISAGELQDDEPASSGSVSNSFGAGLSNSIDIDIVGGSATKLQFVSRGRPRDTLEYESGQEMPLRVRACDEHGNIDKTFNGEIEIKVFELPSGKEVHDSKEPLVQGEYLMTADQWKLRTRANLVNLEATLVPKKKKGSATPKLSQATCCLNVTPGTWPERIEIVRSHLVSQSPTSSKFVLDDSTQDLRGLRACVRANNGQGMNNPVITAKLNGAEYHSQCIEGDLSVVEFEDIKVPFEQGMWPLQLIYHDVNASSRLPDQGFQVHRTPGTPKELTLEVEGSDGHTQKNQYTVCADETFNLLLRTQNALGVHLGREELERLDNSVNFRFELLDEKSEPKRPLKQLKVEVEHLEGDRYTAKIKEVATDLCAPITAEVRTVIHFKECVVKSNTIKLRFHPKAEVAKNVEAYRRLGVEKNGTQEELDKLLGYIEALRKKSADAGKEIAKVRKQIKNMKPKEDLLSDQNDAGRECKALQGTRVLTDVELTPVPSWLSAFVAAANQGALPCKVLGIAHALGYVDTDSEEQSKLFAGGVAALLGSDLAAVVVSAEHYRQWKPFAEQHKIRTRVLAGLTSAEQERVQRVQEKIPEGAHLAVSKLKVERIEPDNAVQKRLLGELWAKLLLDSLIFESTAQMEDYREKFSCPHHRMAAPVGDGTWRVMSLSDVPGEDAPRCVKELQRAVAGESTPEFKAAKKKFDQAGGDIEKLTKLEEKLLEDLKQEEIANAELIENQSQPRIEELKAKIAELEQQENDLQGSEKGSQAAGAGKKRKQPAGRGSASGRGGSSSAGTGRGARSKRAAPEPAEGEPETPRRTSARQCVAASPGRAAAACRNITRDLS